MASMNPYGLEILSNFLKGKVICKDYQTAQKIRAKSIKGVTVIITYAGEIIKKGEIIAVGQGQKRSKFS